jgi:glycosyltransferase involved in cell wall biosynthesis
MIDPKIAVIRSAFSSSWRSCVSIVNNLERAYSLQQSGVKFFLVAEDHTASLIDTAIAIREWRPEKVVLIDHLPDATKVLSALLPLFDKKDEPQVYIHLFGDFSLSLANWRQARTVLYGQKLFFVSASKRHKTFISQFVASQSLGLCPFPVDQEYFFPNLADRVQRRKTLGLTENSKLFIYAGRISLQKNILSLCAVMEQVMLSNSAVHFAIAGRFDDHDAPYFGIKLSHLSYQTHCAKAFENLKTQFGDRFHYLGSLDQESLRSLYRAADTYISLSTFQDEDFGMAPIEALFCGAQAILTDWGGYSDFQGPDVVHLPVALDKTNQFNHRSAIEAVLQQASLNFSSDDRQRHLQNHIERFSLSAVKSQIAKILHYDPPPFQGFSDKCSELDKLSSGPAYDFHKRGDQGFFRTYSAYFARY